MSNIPEVYLLQATKRNLGLAKAFQDDMGAHFFEHTMYDVKDALTSILALCDMEDMKQVPQVKHYIQRVTDLLHDVRFYRSSSLFNVNHVVINVINLMKEKYESKLQINHDLSFIKAYVESDKSHLEQVLLYSLIEALESSSDTVKTNIQLSQKETDAVIFIKLENFQYSPVILKEILAFHKPSVFRMQITAQVDSTEIVVRLPLSFDAKEENPMKDESAMSLTLGDLKTIETQSDKAMNGKRPTLNRVAREKQSVYGAQERT